MVSRLGETRPVSRRLSMALEMSARLATSASVRFWLSRSRLAVRPRSRAGLSERSAAGALGLKPGVRRGFVRGGLRGMTIARYANSVAPQLSFVLIFAHAGPENTITRSIQHESGRGPEVLRGQRDSLCAGAIRRHSRLGEGQGGSGRAPRHGAHRWSRIRRLRGMGPRDGT